MISEVFNMDCKEGTKSTPDKYYDLAVVDPPYGINAANMTMGSNQNRAGRDVRGEIQYGSISVAQKPKKGRLNSGGGHFAGKNLTTMNCDWDFNQPSAEYFTELLRISKNQIIWGGNYFTDKLPASRCWICWDKIQPWDNFSQFELAWTSFDFPCKMVRLSNRGGANDEQKIHPTQKPTRIYSWIYDKFFRGGKVIDTHLESGTNREAAHKAGNIDFTGYEIDADYFLAQEKRFKNYQSQLVMDFKPARGLRNVK